MNAQPLIAAHARINGSSHLIEDIHVGDTVEHSFTTRARLDERITDTGIRIDCCAKTIDGAHAALARHAEVILDLLRQDPHVDDAVWVFNHQIAHPEKWGLPEAGA